MEALVSGATGFIVSSLWHTVGITGRNLDIDSSRAKEKLGWRTCVSYPEAMDKIGAWVRKASV